MRRGGPKTHPAAPPASDRVLQEGAGRRVVHEAGGRTVRKTFSTGPAADGERMAVAEMSRLARFSAALVDEPVASCPRPLELVHDPEPGYRMTWVEGEDLADHLTDRTVPDDRLVDIGRTIARALHAYVTAVGEPYHDLKLGNVLVAPGGDLVFVDVGPPQGDLRPADADDAYEVSVGNLLASVVFDSARPLWFVRGRMRRQNAAVAAAVVDTLGQEVRPLRGDVLKLAAEHAYRRNTFGRGSAPRTLWYATVGRAVGRRVRTSAVAVGPVPLRRG